MDINNYSWGPTSENLKKLLADEMFDKNIYTSIYMI